MKFGMKQLGALSARKWLGHYLERYPWFWRWRENITFPDQSIVLITIDSLRHDVTQLANAPNFAELFAKHGSDGWHKVGSHGTYTLPSHISMFHAGLMPCDNRDDVPPPFNRDKEKLFKAQLAWERTTGATFPTPAAPNIVKGFERLGYRTVGVGGVNWFNDKFETSRLWSRDYFKEFYWEAEFDETHLDSLERQIALIRRLGVSNSRRPCFLFLNISCAHTPYMGFEKSVSGQVSAYEHIDQLLPDLLDAIPRRCYLLILSDHGECFGEDGLWGHGFYHPKIMEVPFAYVRRYV